MKTIGLLGGMSWESTVGYYRALNEGIKMAMGGLHSAKIAMYSVDFEPIKQMQYTGDWEGTARILSEAAKNIQAAGADFLLICTNTMHKVAAEIEAVIQIPLLHIADATAEILGACRIYASRLDFCPFPPVAALPKYSRNPVALRFCRLASGKNHQKSPRSLKIRQTPSRRRYQNSWVTGEL